MSKLIFLDVDGTLVDYHNRIPESAVKAIRQAREKGHLQSLLRVRNQKISFMASSMVGNSTVTT